MYTHTVKTVSQAYCHLFFHCCMDDTSSRRVETAFAAARFVEGGLNSNTDLNKEMEKYKLYKPFVTDETRYLQYLAGVIDPVNPLTLYFYCTEIILCEGTITGREDMLLKNIAYVLEISNTKQSHARKIVREIKTMEAQWAY